MRQFDAGEGAKVTALRPERKGPGKLMTFRQQAVDQLRIADRLEQAEFR